MFLRFYRGVYLPQLSHATAGLRPRIPWYSWHNNLRRRQRFLPIETRLACRFAHIRTISSIRMDGTYPNQIIFE